MPPRAHFTPELFQFLRELDENNTREWFLANKERYMAVVQEPMLAFIAAFSEPLASISRSFVADPRSSGGSMFRIYKDVRFSRDKRPYKTVAAAQFRHRQGRDVHAPGFYLHLEPGNVFTGVGLWHPDSTTLAKIRKAIVDRPGDWRKAVGDPVFTTRHSLSGDTLKRPPRGFDPGHELVEDLKRKDFVSVEELSENAACAPDFNAVVASSFRAAAPLMRFLTRAVELDW